MLLYAPAKTSRVAVTCVVISRDLHTVRAFSMPGSTHLNTCIRLVCLQAPRPRDPICLPLRLNCPQRTQLRHLARHQPHPYLYNHLFPGPQSTSSSKCKGISCSSEDPV
ncbi:hypothetical protein BU26DRAFT_33518 [Trematosphaeria pertusa]|uniref:Uncharacterized protein n=1 Tax=Trematosphaeria pertusa TaxID=390896 RepID=A0A6A6J3K8_9PLEO|nr:uncharacterized protein BU26DRAFT_33518 [Trematosphaeria pertusa]KAF2256991.1 hypothetical protein BU26DRAFT_33518 [Trematosphaeria pertusa]